MQTTSRSLRVSSRVQSPSKTKIPGLRVALTQRTAKVVVQSVKADLQGQWRTVARRVRTLGQLARRPRKPWLIHPLMGSSPLDQRHKNRSKAPAAPVFQIQTKLQSGHIQIGTQRLLTRSTLMWALTSEKNAFKKPPKNVGKKLKSESNKRLQPALRSL